MARKRVRSYPLDFRLKVVELARTGRPADELATEFELSPQTVRNWLKQSDVDAGHRKDGLTSEERTELFRLRKQVKQLTIEREILSKAAAWFARETDVLPKKSFQLVKSNQAKYRIVTICKTLGVSASGYYAWLSREPSPRRRSDITIGDQVEAIHRRSRNTYGRPRIQAELKEHGLTISTDRLARLMRERKLEGASRRKGIRTTIRDRDAGPAPDLVERKFTADAPDRLWVADITYIPTYAGFLFLAVVLDAFSRRIVGWKTSGNMRTQLVVDALNMAIERRRPTDVIHHSDQGTQYTSIAFGSRCREAGVRPSMGSVGDCYDNAMCESFNATLECELLDKHRFRTHKEAELAIFDFIESWYNLHRRHSALGYRSPAVFEREAAA